MGSEAQTNKPPEAHEILTAVGRVKELADSIGFVFTEHMVMKNDEIRAHLVNIYKDCEDLEKRLLLMYVIGYARLDLLNKGRE